MKKKFTSILLICLITMIIFGCSEENPSANNIVASKTTSTSEPKVNIKKSVTSISPDNAKNHIGERKTVCGQIVDSNYAVRSNGSPTFLNFSRPYPNHPFTIVIWGNKRANFPSNPEQYYLNKKVCANGLIESYKGKPQIVANNQSQLSIN